MSSMNYTFISDVYPNFKYKLKKTPTAKFVPVTLPKSQLIPPENRRSEVCSGPFYMFN